MAGMGWRSAAALGSAVVGAGVATVVATRASGRRRTQRQSRRDDDATFGTLHAGRRTVRADDGVLLNVEVDEPYADILAGTPTIVFAHGWVLDLDCWHYQRATLRGRARLVFYDQRSHGRSGRSKPSHATHVQLGRDLKAVLDSEVPDGPVILVGHSMGGMSIMAMADEYPEMFDERVVGVVLLSTSAGELVGIGGPFDRFQPLVMGGLTRLTYLIDKTRGVNQYGYVRRLAVGPDAPERYADMTDEMITRARTHVFFDFYPSFSSLDMYPALAVMPAKRTVVAGGTKDLLTPFRHSRTLAERIEGARLEALEGAGHMIMLEQHERVDEILLDLLANAG